MGTNVAEMAARLPRPRLKSALRAGPTRIFSSARGWALLVLVLLLIGMTFANPDAFLSQGNWIATSTYASTILLLAAGQSVVLISGGVDLSVGATTGLVAIATASAMRGSIAAGHANGAAIVTGLVVGLVVGLVAGFTNGVAVGLLNLPAFIVTLGTMGIARGTGLVVSNGQGIFDNMPHGLGRFGNKNLLGWLPVPFLVAAGVAIVLGLFLVHTRLGHHVYATGSNRRAASRAGIHVPRLTLLVYCVSGLCAAVAGILLVTRYGGASTDVGMGSELDAVAAAVIGGVSLFGGRGGVGGAAIGTAIMSVLVTGLVLAGVQSFWQQVVVGCIVLLAAYVDYLRQQRIT